MSIISYWVIIKEHDNSNGIAFERMYTTYNEAYAMQSDLKLVGITSNITKDIIEVPL
jgi:hypothetical protein